MVSPVNENAGTDAFADSLAHRLMRKVAQLRKEGTFPWLRPDAKAQVTVEYDDTGKPKRVDTVVISTQTSPDVTNEEIRVAMVHDVIKEVIPDKFLDDETKYLINPSGRFVIGGPKGDAGLTGRKIIVDTYGGYARHGGGAFSGKDATKSTEAPHTLRATWLRTLSPLAWLTAVKSSWPTPSGWPTRFPS